MVKAWKPPKESIENFNLVWNYAGCTKEESKHEKEKILSNFNELDLSYRFMADRIRKINNK